MPPDACPGACTAAHSVSTNPATDGRNRSSVSPYRRATDAVRRHNSDDRAAIAEFYILDDNGERLSREPWTIAWVDSEDVEQGNHSADKLFDLQESTYWSTAPGSAFPHSFVIDLGSVRNISAIQYLPRMEHGAPGAIKNYRVYVKTSPFSRSGS